jgi:hypothetical protein
MQAMRKSQTPLRGISTYELDEDRAFDLAAASMPLSRGKDATDHCGRVLRRAAG